MATSYLGLSNEKNSSEGAETGHLYALFEKLEKTGGEGVLTVTKVGGTHRLYFAYGRVTWLFTKDAWTARIAAMLQRSGRVGEAQIKMALHAQRTSSRPLYDILAEMGVLTPPEADEIIRQEARQDLIDLLEWPCISWDFKEGPPPEGLGDDQRVLQLLTFEVREILEAVDAHRKEWQEIRRQLPNLDEVLVPGDQPATVHGDVSDQADRAALLMQVDGERTIEEVITASNLPRLKATRVLVDILQDGAVRLLTDAELWQRIRLCAGEAQAERKASLLKLLIERGDEQEARRELAELYESLGRTHEAAREWIALADWCEAQGRPREALAELRHAARLMPPDLSMRERLFRLSVEAGDESRAIDEGRRLARFYRGQERPEAARQVYSTLAHLAPDNLSLQMEIVEELLGMGDHDGALQLCERIESQVVHAAREQELAAIYERIRAACPDRDDLKGRIRTLRRRERRRTSLSRAHASVLIGLLLLLGVVAAYAAWESKARLALEVTRSAAEAFVSTGNYADAIAVYQKLARRFPFTTIPRQAHSAIESLKKERAQAIANQEERARQLRRRAELLAVTGPLDEAVRLFDEIVGLMKDKPAKAEEARQRAAKIRATIKAARDEYAEAARLEEAGEYQAAFDKYLSIRQKYPSAARGWRIMMPVQLLSEPAGAEVLLNGASVGVTPIVIHYELERPVEIELKKQGFEPIKLSLTGNRKARHSFSLSPEPIWSFQAEAAIQFSPTPFLDRLYLADEKGNLYCLDAKNGKEIWRSAVSPGRAISAAPAVAPDAIYLGSQDGILYARESSNGKPIWDRKLDSIPSSRPAWLDGPYGRTVYIACLDGQVRALGGALGVPQWSFNAGSPVRTPLLTMDDTICFGNTYGNVYRIKGIGGQAVWSRNLGSGVVEEIALRNGIVYVCSQDTAWSLDGATGATRWSVFMMEGFTSGPAVREGYIAARAGKQSVVLLDAAKGTQCWRFDAETPITSPAIGEGGDRVFVGSAAGKLLAIDIQTGRERWRASLPAPPATSPVVSSGLVCIVAGKDRVLAFSERP